MKKVFMFILVALVVVGCQTSTPRVDMSGVWNGSMTATSGGSGTQPLRMTLSPGEERHTYTGVVTVGGSSFLAAGAVREGNEGVVIMFDSTGDNVRFTGGINQTTYSGLWRTDFDGGSNISGTFSLSRP